MFQQLIPKKFGAAEAREETKAESKTEAESKTGGGSKMSLVAENMKLLEKSREKEERRFKRCIRAANELYIEIVAFMSELKTNLKDGADIETIKSQAMIEYTGLLARLREIEGLTWREQTRGPTSNRSWSVDGTGSSPVLWLLFTPPTERTIQGEGRTVNYSEGNWLTWGLPLKNGSITLDLEKFKRGTAVFVIEKDRVLQGNGRTQVQHHIKGLYYIFKKIEPGSTKLSTLTWEHLFDGWMKDVRNQRGAPEWVV